MSQDSARKHAFQAEVKQVLDIVIHSLYTHREIFVRELVSNATDALEKLRYEKVVTKEIADPDLDLEIRIDVDESNKTITITDTGIGMTEEEIIASLGTIAHSGTREFLKHVSESPSQDVQLIGQFGVGFYASFMVAKEVKVFSRSYKPDATGVEWTSTGDGEYTVEAAERLKRGTKVLLTLRDDAEEFASADKIEEIVKQYSNFVPFPIYIGDKKVNTIQAIWTRNKSDIKDGEYAEFYKYIANAHDEPIFRLHFTADAPLQISSLLFVPAHNMEQFGFGRTEPGVNLYCRKVLIQQNSDAILPEWLRFVRGVVDSEDLPLNISRETFQDNALIKKLRKVITSRFLKFLGEQAGSDGETYEKFWKTFGAFLKEGATADYEYRNDIAPLLRYDTSKEAGKLVSMADYVSRMKAGQTAIYYINGPTRNTIEAGPYMETFKKKDIEVLYLYQPVDDFVLSAIREYDGKKIVSADQADLNLPDTPDVEEKEESEPKETMTPETVESLAGWMKKVLGERVEAVKPSKRLVDSPAVIVNTDAMMTSNMQRVMQAINQDFGQIGRKTLEINPQHPIMRRLSVLRETGQNEDFLKKAVEQIFDNALIAAGLMADPRPMVNRNYEILQKALQD